MKLHRAFQRAILLGAMAAMLTFVPNFFADDYRDWRYRQQGIIVCGSGDSGVQTAIRTFVAFAAVFTPAFLLSAGRIRNVFQNDGN